jgi:glycosyltransferase involved in cell wall biosynthesis
MLPWRAVRIFVDYRPALRERTGVGEYVHEVARALVATAPADESLTLFSASWKDRLDPAVLPGALTIDRRLPVRVLNFAWHRLEWPTVEALTGQTFDVAHSFHPLLAPTSDAAGLVTIYDLDFLDHPERSRAEIRRDYPALAASHAARADHVLVISHHTARAVGARLGVADDRISIAHPGAPDWPRRTAEPAEGCILFLGTIEPRKNVGVLLDAYERLLATSRDAPPLVLAGGSTAEAAPVLRRTQLAPLAGRVETPGYVEAAGRLDVYRRALVFVIPSHTEGFGMTVLEAMTVGVPVIASARGALPEAAGSAARLVDPDDAAGLADAIAEILANRALRDRMREDGWRQAAAFRWHDTATSVRHAWTRAIAARSRRRG